MRLLFLKWKHSRKDESESTLESYLEPLCLVGDTSEVPDPLTWDKVVNLILRLVGIPTCWSDGLTLEDTCEASFLDFLMSLAADSVVKHLLRLDRASVFLMPG